MASGCCAKCNKAMERVPKKYRCTGCGALYCPSCMDRFCLFCKKPVQELSSSGY